MNEKEKLVNPPPLMQETLAEIVLVTQRTFTVLQLMAFSIRGYTSDLVY